VPDDANLVEPGVLLLADLFPPAVGGSPVLFEAIYSRLKRTRVTVLSDTWSGAPPPPHPSLRVIRRPIHNQGWGVLNPRSLGTYLRMVREIRRTGVDGIVHCASVMPEGFAGWMNQRLGGHPYVCWSHGEDVVIVGRSRELSFLANRVYRGAAANIVNSRNTGRLLEQRGIPSSRIHVVHPGVDVLRFRPDVDGSAVRARYAGPGELLLLSVGRLQRRKGHDLAIEAVAQLGTSLPVHYVIVGDGQERPTLEALAARLGVSSRVHFVGEAPDADLPAFYAACDLFLMPNRVDDDGDIEGFGIVFLEAAASGRPAIGGRSGGVSEAIVDGQTGVLVSGTDPVELAEVIRGLAQSPDARRSMGEAGRARAVDAFTWDRAGAQVDDIHAAVVSARRGDTAVKVALR
jgi:phosphatidylinositol alpha-1,6-mannosyltransferase